MAGKSVRVWQRSSKAAKPSDQERRRIIDVCEVLIREFFKPRYLAEIKPTEFNYRVDIHGDWRAGRYRFLQRMRSGFADNLGDEFDHPFARLDSMGHDRFDIQWMRHTGSWWRLHTARTLDEAIDLLKTNRVLHPPASESAMSECLHDEFQAVDRPLSDVEKRPPPSKAARASSPGASARHASKRTFVKRLEALDA